MTKTCTQCNTIISPQKKIHNVSYRDNLGLQIELLFCCSKCKLAYDKIKRCTSCTKYTSKSNIINGHHVCSNTISSTRPTCIELFTGNYICSFCKHEKNANDFGCYYTFYDDSMIYICNKCYSFSFPDQCKCSYNCMNYDKCDSGWIEVYENCPKYNKIISKYIWGWENLDECLHSQ